MSSFEGERPPPTRTAVFLQVAFGVMLTFALHVLVGCTLAFTGTVAGAVAQLSWLWLMGLSVAQLAYVGPAALAMAFVRKPIALGMIIGAAITLLLQGTCYGVFFVALGNL